MISLDNYTASDLISWLGADEVAKGRGYLSAVSALQRNGEMLLARVRGTRITPYEVVVQVVGDDRRGGGVLSHCSCPVGRGCKHVAATLLVWLGQRADPNRPREEVLAWIAAFRGVATGQAVPRRSVASATHALRYLIAYQPGPQQYGVSCFKVRLDRQGAVRSVESWNNIERALDIPPAFIDDTDMEILRLLWAHKTRGVSWGEALPLNGRNAEALMERLVESGRAHKIGRASCRERV